MKHLVQLTGVAILMTACAPPATETPAVPAADLVLSGARIYTVDGTRPWAEAVAITGDRFVYVGDADGAVAYVGDATRVVELDDRLVLPGLIDGHTHPGLMGIEQYGSVTEDSSREAFLAELEDYADQTPGDGWLRVCCWPNSLYVVGSDGPHKRDLDAVIPDRPLWVTSGAWHSYWLNSAGLEALGIDDETPDPRPGVAMYERDADGNLTGWLKEGAGWQYFRDVFDVDPDLNRDETIRFLDVLSSHGVTTVYDGGNLDFSDSVYSILAELDKAGRLPVRYEGTYMISTPDRRHRAVAEMRRMQATYGGPRLQFRTIKLFMDGINENHTAAMLEPYADDPEHRPETTLTTEELRDLLIELHEEQFDLHIHTIGDLAVRRALDAVEAAMAEVGESFYPRVTLAHLQNIHPEDRHRFGELGVSANFTPWWHGVDQRDVTEAALGADRYNDVYTARPLFESGGNVTFSSDDWRLDVLSPFLGMQVAHNRQYPDEWLEEDGGDPDAFKPPASEKLDLELMIRGYTINGAYPFRMEDDIGSIEVGKLADLVVLEEDVFSVDRRRIHAIEPTAVMMEGIVVSGALP
jgi:predicted amidohydrolase YtcJ